MTLRSGAGLGGNSLSVAGEGTATAEPAQAKTTSSPEAPKPAKADSTGPDGSDDQDKQDVGAIEMIEPTTGEIIVLSQHKPVSDTGADAASTAERVMPLAKPEKRKNAKERAKARFAKAEQDNPAEDGITPETTATAKSEAGAKSATAKSAEVLAANEAKRERKAAAKAKAGARKGEAASAPKKKAGARKKG